MKQYFSSLRERDELDAVLPEILSGIGLEVFSRPSRGTQQRGVDIAAVGPDPTDGVRKVFLFSVKSGDLTRHEWNNAGAQSLRPSLDEIIDAYIPSRLSPEYASLPIVICPTFGGDTREDIRDVLKGYIDQNTNDRISFQEWNGDRLTTHLLTGLFREELLPEQARTAFRKAVAMVDEPDIAYHHFARMIHDLMPDADADGTAKLSFLRQSAIATWILFVWAREAENLRGAMRAAELAVLSGWHVARNDLEGKAKTPTQMRSALEQLIHLDAAVRSAFIEGPVAEYAKIPDGLATAVPSASSVDVNLALFDLVGRLGLQILYLAFQYRKAPEDEQEYLQERATKIKNLLVAAVTNNDVLLCPVRDDQSIDLTIAMLALQSLNDTASITAWVSGLIERTTFAFMSSAHYPRPTQDYRELVRQSDKDKAKSTNANTLIPTLTLWAIRSDADDALKDLMTFSSKHYTHSTAQLWVPGPDSEENLYINSSQHGYALTMKGDDSDLMKRVVSREVRENQHFATLSAQAFGIWYVIVLACWHHRLPVPPQLWFPDHGENDAAESAVHSN
ncbi:hypothetical protein GGQ59_000006 [Parvularcula dongshanensis]|uniref:Chemotaxis protein n=1 Tax=Parvularcula dongshanensis TaxID=1173995 RepID=A0A840HXF0_9PROT|nr:hypothetical protein [Parvularcula dongshanensis]